MIAVLAVALVVIGAVAGLIGGYKFGTRVTAEAHKLIRYAEAIGILRDLVNTPDAINLRPRAEKVLNAHRQNSKE